MRETEKIFNEMLRTINFEDKATLTPVLPHNRIIGECSFFQPSFSKQSITFVTQKTNRNIGIPIII